MLKKFKQQMKNEKGLTLIELLAVIVILAIIAAIAVPAIGNIITNSKVNALKADGQNVLAAASLYFIENSGSDTLEDPVELQTLIDDGFLEDAGGFVATSAVAPTVEQVTDGTGNKISGTAANGDITVAFDGATNAMITAAGVKADGDYDGVTVGR